MSIAAAEDWLIAVCKDELGSAVSVIGGPGTWDGAYLKKLLTEGLPAVVVAFDGGEAVASTSLTLDATWMLYVVTGWAGKDEEFRRRGDAATKGAYVILTELADRLHNTNMGERQFSANGSPIANAEAIDGFGHIRVASVTNEWAGELDRAGVAIYAIELTQQLPLLGVDAEGFDDFLRARGDLEIADDPVEPVEIAVDIPQT